MNMKVKTVCDDCEIFYFKKGYISIVRIIIFLWEEIK